MLLISDLMLETRNAITTRYQSSPDSLPGAGLKRFASSELLKIETAILVKDQTEMHVPCTFV